MNPVIYFNGQFLARDQAAVSPSNGGWLHGAGLFETLRAHRGGVFRLENHLERLLASAAALLIPLERKVLPSPQDFRELLDQNGLLDARLRLTLTAGDVNSAPHDGQSPPLTLCVTATALEPYPAALYDHGMSVVVSKYRQSRLDPLAGHKTTSHLSRLLALKEAHRLHCGEALWFSTENVLAEGCISNVFVAKDGVLATPPIDTPALPGIARRTVLEMCASQGLTVKERSITIDDLLDADEVFLTNTIMQIMPVTRIERRSIGTGKAGPIARGLLEQYRQRVDQECTPTWPNA